jgi:hypothetical protein
MFGLLPLPGFSPYPRAGKNLLASLIRFMENTGLHGGQQNV